MNHDIFRQLEAQFKELEETIAAQNNALFELRQNPLGVCPMMNRAQAVPQYPKLKLENYTWQEIARYAQAGIAQNYFSLGDTKTIFLSDGNTLHVRIIGFNHDRDPDRSTHYKPLPITFETVETLNDDFSMNIKNTNKGGWKDSDLRAVLNTKIFEMLPDDLKAVIRPCLKLTSAGERSENLIDTVDRLFILSEQEIFGRKIFSRTNEGRWYDWYRLENVDYWKCKQNGQRDWRWERSPIGSNSTPFCNVNSSGTANYNPASYTYGVSFGFCV